MVNRFIIMISFSVGMIASTIISTITRNMWWEIPFLVFLVGFIITFILSIRYTKRMRAYWSKCREMCHVFSVKMLECVTQGDFEGAESYDRRARKVLSLWDESLKTDNIPKGPDLEDV